MSFNRGTATLQNVVIADPNSGFSAYTNTNPQPVVSRLQGFTDVALNTSNKNILVNADGKLQVDVCLGQSSGGGGGDATLAEQQTQTTKLTEIDTVLDTINSGLIAGTQKIQVLGNTQGDGSGTSEHLHTDGNGNLNTQVINTISTNAFRTVIGSGATNSHALVDTDGHVQVDIVGNSSGVGDATLAEQQTQTTKLTEIDTVLDSLDGKVTACNTGAVTVASSALPTGASTLSEQQTQTTKLTSLDGKVTACDTGSVTVASSVLPTGASTLAEQQTQTTKLTEIDTVLDSLDGKVTACNTGAVTVASSALPTGASSETTLLLAEAHLGNIDTQTSSIQSNVATSSNQTNGTQEARCMGNNSGSQVQIQVDALGVVATSGSGGGGAGSNTYTPQTISVVPSGVQFNPQITNGVGIDLTNAKGVIITASATSSSDLQSDVTMNIEFDTALGTVGGTYAFGTPVGGSAEGFSPMQNINFASTGTDTAILQAGDTGTYDSGGGSTPIKLLSRFCRVTFLHADSTGLQNTYSVTANFTIIPL